MDIFFLTSIFYLTIGVLLLLLGLLIFRENPSQRINRATSVMIFFAAIAPIMAAFGLIIFKMNAQLNINMDFFKRIFLVWEFFFPQLLYFSFLFPREQKIIQDLPRIIYFIYLPYIFHFAVVLCFHSSESILALVNIPQSESTVSTVLQPLQMIVNLFFSGLSIFYDFHVNFFALINLIYVITALIIMYRGYQALTSPRMRHQVALVLWGIRVSVGLYAIAFILPKIFPFNASEVINYFLTIIALLIGAVSIAWAMIKYQFLDISLSISRNFLFSISTALLLGVYLVVYDRMKLLTHTFIGFDLPVMEVILIIIAAIVFQPTLAGIEKVLDRIFGRDKSDYQHVLKMLSHDILTIMDIDALKNKITTTLTESMRLENVHLIIETKTRDYEVVCERDGETISHRFSRNCEFIRLMRTFEKPVSYDEVIARTTPGKEADILNRMNCYLLMPLSHRGHLNGILCLGNKLTRTSFSAEDATLLSVLSDQIAIALENIDLYKDKLEKQRMEEEISVAREIQRMLLPNKIPSGRNFDISAMNVPSKEVGGDYYDFLQWDDHHVGVAIGDISGKGIPGAMLMSNLQATFRASAWKSLTPAEIMKKVNNQISHTTSPEKYATFFYGILDARALTFTYTNAGHNYPIFKKHNGQYCHLTGGGLIVGVQPDFDYEETSIQLEPGDTLVFYTDGITEALNPSTEEFGEKKLLHIILQSAHRTAEELRNYIYEEVTRFTGGESQYDDLTLIVLRVL
ncbi:MAG: GAF domain-containing SpoIIE family protein phosphatase [Candidatus Zhuqueibacterota bacterium]